MKAMTTFERLMPTTADGEVIKVTTIYSSFDKEEIDNLQAGLRSSIGAGVMVDTDITSQKSKLTDEQIKNLREDGLFDDLDAQRDRLAKEIFYD